MRLKEMMSILNVAIPMVQKLHSQPVNGPPTNTVQYYTLTAVGTYVDGLSMIARIPSLATLASNAMGFDLLKLRSEPVNVPVGMHDSIIKMQGSVLSMATVLLSALMDTVPKSSPGVDILMPDGLPLDAFAEMLSTLGKIVNQSAPTGQNSAPVVRSVDTGSIWLVVTVTNYVYRLLASMAWSAEIIRQKHVEVTFAAEQVRSLEIDNNTKDSISHGIKTLIDALTDAEARRVLKENGGDPGVESERVERIKNSLRELVAMQDKGLRILPSAPATAEPKNLFPPTIASDVKALMTSRPQLPANTESSKTAA